MLEKIKTFVKTQIQKIPPWWKIYYNLCNELYRPVRGYSLVIFADWFERKYVLEPLIEFARATRKNKIIMALKYTFSVVGVVSLGTVFLVATGLAAPAVVPELFFVGILFGLYSPIFATNLLQYPAFLQIVLSKSIGAIAIFITNLGVYANNKNALLAKAELAADKNLLREFDPNKNWVKIKNLYTRSEELGNPDAHNLLVNNAAALLMREYFPQKDQEIRKGDIWEACPYEPLELDQELKKEAFEKMIHRRYVKLAFHPDQALFRQPTSYYKESDLGLTPMMHAIARIKSIDYVYWLFNLDQESKNQKIKVITDLLIKSEESLPLESQVKILTAKFHDGQSVLNVLRTEPPFVSADFNDIRNKIDLIMESFRDNIACISKDISKGNARKDADIKDADIKKVADYIINYSPEIDHELIAAIAEWKDEDREILYDQMSAQEDLMAEEIREKMIKFNEGHQKQLMEDQQSVHAAGKDGFKSHVKVTLKNNFKIKNNREINDGDIDRLNKELKGHIDSLLKQSESGEGSNKGPKNETIKEALKVYEYLMQSQNSKEMMALVWMAVQDTDKLTGSQVAGFDPKIISENLKESIIFAMSNVTKAYSWDDKATDHFACIPGAENGLALVLNHYYLGFEFNDGFEKVGDVERIRDGGIIIDQLKQKVIEEAKKHSGNDASILLDMFLSYPSNMAFNDDFPFWKVILNTSLDAIWKKFPLSRSRFLNVWVMGREDFSINPLMLLKPEFDLEAQYMAFCKSRTDYDSLKNAIFCNEFEGLLKEFSDFVDAPPWIKDNMEAIFRHGLQFVDKGKLKNLIFDYEKHYIDFCESIISESEDEVDEEVRKKYMYAVHGVTLHVKEFSEYLQGLNLTVPECQIWQLGDEAIKEALHNLQKYPVELKKLQWKSIDGTDRQKALQGSLEEEYRDFCKSLDAGDVSNFKKAINMPQTCIKDFEAYLAKKYPNELASDKWHLKGYPVSVVLGKLNANPEKLKELKNDLLKYEREHYEKEHEEVIQILLGTSNPSMVFPRRSVANAEAHSGVDPNKVSSSPRI